MLDKPRLAAASQQLQLRVMTESVALFEQSPENTVSLFEAIARWAYDFATHHPDTPHNCNGCGVGGENWVDPAEDPFAV